MDSSRFGTHSKAAAKPVLMAALVMAGFFVAGFLVTLLSGLNPGQDLIGIPNSYTTRYFWEFWTVKHEITENFRIPIRLMTVEYPIGGTLAPTAPIPGLVYMMTSLLVGDVPAYNILILVQLAITTYAVYVLGKKLFRSSMLGIFGAAATTFSPWLLSMGLATGDLVVLSFGWSILSMLFLWESLQEVGYRKVLYASFFLIVQFYTSPPNAVFVVLFSPLIFLIASFFTRSGAGLKTQFQWRSLLQRGGKYMLYLASAGLFIAPYWLLVTSMMRDPVSFLYEKGFALTPDMSEPDPESDYYRDPTLIPLSEFFMPIQRSETTLNEGWVHKRFIFPGFCFWLLAIVSVWRSRNARILLVFLGIGLFGCIGPYIVIDPGLWSVKSLSPIFWYLRLFRAIGGEVLPIRFCPLAITAAALMVAAGLKSALPPASSMKRKVILIGFSALLIIGESLFYTVPLLRGAFTTVVPLQNKEWRLEAGQDAGVVSLPVFVSGTGVFNNQALLFQTRHRLPIINPCLPKLTGRFLRNEFLKLLLAMELPELIELPIPNPESSAVKDGISQLLKENVGYVLIDQGLYRAGVAQQVLEVLRYHLGEPTVLSERVLLFRIQS